MQRAKCIQNPDIGRFVRTIERYLVEVHSRATSLGVVSAETKINAMKSFEKSGREHAKEKEREAQRQFINRLMYSLLVTYKARGH